MFDSIDITVLICVHSTNENYDKMMMNAIDSLKKQTYKYFKVLVVLDECWSNTKQTLLNIDNLDLTILEKDKKEGLAIAKNYGIKHIDTKWTCFLDADDMYVSKKLERQVEYVKINDVDFLGTQALNQIYGKIGIFDSCFKLGEYETHNQIKNIIYKQNVMTHGSMMIKTECLKQLGGYNNVKGQEDWDLWKRAFNKGYKFYQIQERLYLYTIGTSVNR